MKNGVKLNWRGLAHFRELNDNGKSMWFLTKWNEYSLFQLIGISQLTNYKMIVIISPKFDIFSYHCDRGVVFIAPQKTV